MPSQKRKDDDLVPKDQPERPPKRAKESQLYPDIPPPNALPLWNPLVIENNLEQGRPQLPRSVNRASPIELFRLFFTDKWLDEIARCTNANAKKLQKEAVLAA